MLFFNSPTLLLAGSLASALAQTGYGHGSNNDTKPGANDSLANAPYSTCRSLAFFLIYTTATTNDFIKFRLVRKTHSSLLSSNTCNTRYGTRMRAHEVNLLG
jgi:hypothetical protein